MPIAKNIPNSQLCKVSDKYQLVNYGIQGILHVAVQEMRARLCKKGEMFWKKK